MNKDTKKAAAILIGWAALCLVGLVGISDARYGMTLIGAATFGLAEIIYSSWLIERVEKRTRRLVEAENERLKGVLKNDRDYERGIF